MRFQLVADDLLDILGGLGFVARSTAAAELDGESGEKLLESLRIADLRRVCDFDGVLELVGEERNETALRPLCLDGDPQIPMVPSRDDVVRQVPAQGSTGEFRLDVDNHI